jgi:hypothetical protein
MLRAPVATTPTADAGAARPAVIPLDSAVAQLLRQLQAVAEQTNVTLAAVTPAPLSENPSGPGGSMQLTIAASGSHAAVQAYIQGLRDLERLLVIEQVAVNTPVAEPDQPQQPDQLQLSVRVFTLQAPLSAAIPTPTSTP